jgi:hypothetical protein
MAESGAPGAVETSDRVAERVDSANDLDFLIHIGDLSYSDGRVALWDSWMDIIEPYASKLPYHVSIGSEFEGSASAAPPGCAPSA